MQNQQVPLVDLALFTDGDDDARKMFIQQLGDAFRTYGFVTVKNHGISDDLVKSFYNASYKFFELDTDVKGKYEDPEQAGQRGFTSFGKEHAKGSDVGDLKEFFQFGQETDDKVPGNTYGDNPRVKEIPEINVEGMRLYRAFEESGRQLLRAIAIYLKLDEYYFDTKIKNGNSILRTIFYPAIDKDPASAIRAEAHEDINLITLLVGASARGLQVQNLKGEWLDVIPGRGEIAINVGDMLQRLTNNYLRSTTHRVINPPKELWGSPRLSIPFFLHPQNDMDLTCLDHCIGDDGVVHYEPIEAGDYLDERLKEIGLK